MENQYDSHSYRMGQYDLTQIKRFAEAGSIPQSDVERRIVNVSAMISKDLCLLIDGLFETIKGKRTDLPCVPISINKWSEELEFYYNNKLVNPALAQKRIASGKSSYEETKWAYKNNLVDSKFVNGRLKFDHKSIPFGEIDMMYEFGLVSSDYANERLRTQPNTTSFGEIDKMYEHRLIDPEIIEERIARGPSVSEYNNIEKFYPEIAKKHKGKKEAMQKKINWIFSKLERKLGNQE